MLHMIRTAEYMDNSRFAIFGRGGYVGSFCGSRKSQFGQGQLENNRSSGDYLVTGTEGYYIHVCDYAGEAGWNDYLCVEKECVVILLTLRWGFIIMRL